MNLFSTLVATALLAASTLAFAQTPPDGRGVKTYPDGGRYEGDFKDGKRNGRGVYTFARGDRYEGEFKDNKLDGRGVYTWKNGGRYEGDYKDDERHGRGVEIFPSGNRYEGEYRDGKRNGRGVLTFASGNRYEGEWQDGKQNGRGVATFANGDRYEGEFKDDKFNGRGVYAFANGYRYEGEYRDGLQDGQGVSTAPNGTRWEGAFRSGKAHGRLVVTYADGSRREGEYRDGKFINGRHIDSTGKFVTMYTNGEPGPKTAYLASEQPAAPASAASAPPSVAVSAAPTAPPAVPDGALPWPKITRADLGACRSEIAEFHRREIAYWRKEAADEKAIASKSRREVSERNIKIYLESAAESAKQDDFSWFIKGNGHCEASDYPCFGADYDFLSHDTKEQWKDSSDNRREAAQREPSRGPSLEDYSTVVDACVSKVWVAKLDAALKLASNKASVASRPTSTSATNAGGALSPQQIASCSEDIRRAQLESQSWPGNANDVAARLGRFQKDLFEGRCAKHPEAKAYLAGANKMLGYGGNATAGGAGSQAASVKRDTKSTENNPAHNASNCIKIYGPAEMKALGMHDVLSSKMVNTCNYDVSVTWCVAAGNGHAGDCKPGYSNVLNLSGTYCVQGHGCTSSYGVDADGQRVHYAACRYNPDRGWGFLPVKLDPRQPFQFSCS